MGFDASRAVEPLDFDFNPHVDVQGTIEEPSEACVRKFQAGLARQAQTLGIDPQIAADPRQMVTALAKVDEQVLEQAADALTDALAELCQGHPSRDQIAALPPRIRNAFMGWLSGLLFGTAENPTSPNPGTSRSPATANGAGISG